MNVHFEDKALEELYHDKTTKDKRYKKLSRDSKFVDAYLEVIDLMYAVNKAQELSKVSYLHYERLKGRPESSVRIINGRVERLLFTEHEDGIKVKILEIDSNHYGKKR